jgi:hypothetical protein
MVEDFKQKKRLSFVELFYEFDGSKQHTRITFDKRDFTRKKL